MSKSGVLNVGLVELVGMRRMWRKLYIYLLIMWLIGCG